MEHFPDAKRYGDVTLQGTLAIPYIIEPDDDAKRELEALRALPDSKRTDPTLNLAFDQRFMAKLGLGIGYNMFGPSFLKAEYTEKLRCAMREKDLAKRSLIGLRGKSFLEAQENTIANDRVNEVMGWKGAYTIRLQIVDNKLALALHLPDGKPTTLLS